MYRPPLGPHTTFTSFKSSNAHSRLTILHSKWFMLALGPLQLHKLLDGFSDKSAQAVCTFGYCAGPGHEPILFQGRTDGTLVQSRGPTVFGKWVHYFEGGI